MRGVHCTEGYLKRVRVRIGQDRRVMLRRTLCGRDSRVRVFDEDMIIENVIIE